MPGVGPIVESGSRFVRLRADSIQAVRHLVDAKRRRGQFNGLDLGGADVNAVVSHVETNYAFVEIKVTFDNRFRL